MKNKRKEKNDYINWEVTTLLIQPRQLNGKKNVVGRKEKINILFKAISLVI